MGRRRGEKSEKAGWSQTPGGPADYIQLSPSLSPSLSLYIYIYIYIHTHMLMEMEILLPDWKIIMRRDEAIQRVIDTAEQINI